MGEAWSALGGGLDPLELLAVSDAFPQGSGVPCGKIGQLFG